MWDVADGGRVVLEEGAVIADGCRFHVGPGAHVVVGAGARLGRRCVVTAHDRVEVGARALLGPEVVLLDFDHVVADVETPVRAQGLATGPVRIGENAALDAAAVVLRGVTVGAGARVGLRAVVCADVAPGATVEGVPARAPGVPGPRGERLARRR
jgi:acetyltransferase-like isoleucine patch superfamily enzyme